MESVCTLATKSNKRGANRRVTQIKSPVIRDLGIPSFQSDFVQTWKTRFYVNDAASSDVVSVTQELPIVPYGISTSSTAIVVPFKSVRLKKVEMWCNYRESKGIVGNTINLTMVERRSVRPIEISDTATFTKCAHIVAKFSKFDTLGWFYATTVSETNPELRFALPKGAVLELTYDYVVSDGDALPSFGGSGFTVNRVYTNAMNGDLDCVGRTYDTQMLI